MADKSTPLGITLNIIGRVVSVSQRTVAGVVGFRTLIKTPAADPFSNPSTFEVRSKSRLGTEGASVEVLCEVLGFPRTYNTKDGEPVKTAEIVLQAA